ncbi:MAG: efflux RND transporter periplasmic adaptor subunit [Pseudomonadales bacterium]|nr:efflux RND transporter periplasmic adaptor subunit [Pseudomonadales bacterium]
MFLEKVSITAAVFLFAIGGQALAQDSAPAPIVSNDCIIEPHKVVNVGSPVEAVIRTVKVDRGDVVKEWQVVAQLESGVEQASVDLAKERANFDQRNVERNKDLYEQQLISIHEKDELETDSFLSKMDLQHAKAILSQRSIYTPINGVVIERFLNEGEFVGSEPILKIAQLNPLNVEVILPVDAFGQVKKGMLATVLPQQPVGGEYTAKVVIVDAVVDAASGTIGVRLELKNPSNRLPAGLKCRVEFNP